VGHGHDGILVGLAHHQAPVLGLRSAHGHARSVSAIAQDVADDVVAGARAAHLVQPVDLAAAHGGAEHAAVARDQAQFTQVLGRDEAGAHQTEAGQHGQPFRIQHVVPAPGHMLDEMRIDHPGRDARVLQVREDALPANAGALHDTTS